MIEAKEVGPMVNDEVHGENPEVKQENSGKKKYLLKRQQNF